MSVIDLDNPGFSFDNVIYNSNLFNSVDVFTPSTYLHNFSNHSVLSDIGNFNLGLDIVMI
jgi:hypothetical protein